MSSATLETKDRLLSQVEAAEFLGIKPETLARWRCVGRYPGLKFVRVGSRVKYRMSDIAAWLESRTVAGEAAEN